MNQLKPFNQLFLTGWLWLMTGWPGLLLVNALIKSYWMMIMTVDDGQRLVNLLVNFCSNAMVNGGWRSSLAATASLVPAQESVELNWPSVWVGPRVVGMPSCAKCCLGARGLVMSGLDVGHYLLSMTIHINHYISIDHSINPYFSNYPRIHNSINTFFSNYPRIIQI